MIPNIKQRTLEFVKAKKNRQNKIYEDNIRAHALYDYYIKIYDSDLKEQLEEEKEEYKDTKDFLEELNQKIEDIESRIQSGEQGLEDNLEEEINIRKITKDSINRLKLSLGMSDIYGVLINYKPYVFEISAERGGYITKDNPNMRFYCITDGDVHKLLDSQFDVYREEGLEYIMDGNFIQHLINRYPKEFLKVDKIEELLLTYNFDLMKEEITENPEIYFSHYDEDDPLTYPTNEEIDKLAKEMVLDQIHYSSYISVLEEHISTFDLAEDGVKIDDFFVGWDYTYKYIIENFSPKEILCHFMDDYGCDEIVGYEYEGREFYIRQLANNFDTYNFISGE